MSFSAVFKFDGGVAEGYEVVSSLYMFSQATDDKGRPSSAVQGGGIMVQVVSTDDRKLVEMMMDPYRLFSGSLVYKRQDVDATLKELVFQDAYCVQYSDSFANHHHTSTLTVTLPARVLTVGGVSIINNW